MKFISEVFNFRLDGRDKSDKIWKCWVRSDNGIREIQFDSFLKYWASRE